MPKIEMCKNCRWWEIHTIYEGFCRLNSSNTPWMIPFMKVKPRDNNEPSVWAKHDMVRTSPNFGCNQWEPK